MLEFFLELIIEIIFEGSVYIYETKKKVPLIFRILAGLIVASAYLGISGFCIFMGISALKDKAFVATFLFFGVALFVLVGGFYQSKKQYSSRKESN